MIRLTFNELYKIFHKKLLYIFTGVVIFLMLAAGILNNTLDAYSVDGMMIDLYKSSVTGLDLEKESDAEMYVTIQPLIDTVELTNQKGYSSRSSEKYFIDNTIYNDYSELYTAKYIHKDEEKINTAQAKLDKDLEFLNNYNWRLEIEDKIKDDEVLLSIEVPGVEDTSNYLKEEIRVLKYRLDNEIPYSYSEASSYLEQYLFAYQQYEDVEKDESKIIKKEDLSTKRSLEANVAMNSYMIDNNLIKNDFTVNTAYDSFSGMFMGVNIFVIVCILMIAGQIVAEEYSKGTIKQLLVRPYTRTKILVSKMIATFITVCLFMLVIAVADGIITGIFTGTLNTLFEPNYVYSYVSHSVVKTNVIFESFMNFIAVLPEIAIITLFTLLMSALIGNTALSVILGFILTYLPMFFEALVQRVKILSYLPMYNWDLTEYLYGGISTSKYASLPKSIIVDVVTIILLIVGAIIVFKKKDIKNQ